MGHPVLKLQDIDLESIPIPESCSPDIPEKENIERRVVRRVENHEKQVKKPEHYEEEVVVEEDEVVPSAEDKKLFDSMMNNLINTRAEAQKEKEKGSRYLVRYLIELWA